MITMKPYVYLNAAMTADGKIATKDSSLKISGEDDLIRVHQVRKDVDAIMVGINTVIIDDPKLTIHKIDAEKSDNPIRVIIDSNGRIPPTSRLLNDDAAKTIVVIAEDAPQENIEKLEGICDIIIAGKGHVNLKVALEILYEKYNVKSILLEGGSTLNFSMFKEHLIDKLSICIGSKILGGCESKTLVDGEGFNASECVDLKISDVKKIDDDILIEYDVVY